MDCTTYMWVIMLLTHTLNTVKHLNITSIFTIIVLSVETVKQMNSE